MGKILKVTEQTKNRFLNLYELDTVKKTGKAGKYFVASRAEKEADLKLVTHKNKPDGVAMYAVCGDQKDKVLLVRQYRYAIDGFIYEFPAGLVDTGETFREAAVREVREETGLTFRPIETDPIYEEPRFMTIGMTDESCAMVYGYADGTMTQKYLEETEEIEAVLADKGEIRRILKEENVAAPCAYQLMHFLADPEPFGFLTSNKEI